MIIGLSVRNEKLTVNGTAIAICVEVPERKLLVIKNRSTGGQSITLTFGRVATADVGIVLSPNDVWVESAGEGYEVWNGAITGISSAAGGVLSIHER